MASIIERFRKGWNAFIGRDPTEYSRQYDLGFSSGARPDRVYLSRGNERTIVSAVYCRIALDVAAINFSHVKLDEAGRFKEPIDSGLQNCLTLEANRDQISKSFIQDVVISMFDEGCVAVVPTDTTKDPRLTQSYDVLELRTARILQWYPGHIKVELYNENTGLKEQMTFPKEMVAIIENPLFAIMNQPNSTLQRLIRTINRLDVLNEQNSSGRLDMIIQLPYPVRNEMRKEQAEMRRKEIEEQLVGSKYGIAYADGTERIIQLNRAVENNLWEQANSLTQQLYNQLGLTQAIFEGSADEQTMINYYNRTIDPICAAISDEMMRKFISKTARSQGQAIRYFRDPFKIVPVSQLAEIADKMTRNEIMSSNELRSEIGLRPVEDPRADELRNKNLNQNNAELLGNSVSTATDEATAEFNNVLTKTAAVKLDEQEAK